MPVSDRAVWTVSWAEALRLYSQLKPFLQSPRRELHVQAGAENDDRTVSDDEASQLFMSYSREAAFEAGLLQYAIENLLGDVPVTVWTYQRDQPKSERSIATSLRDRVRGSAATIFLVSPATLAGGAAQGMELAYSDAFAVPTFVLLQGLTFAEIKSRDHNVPPLLPEGQCSVATEWRNVVAAIRGSLDGTRSRRS